MNSQSKVMAIAPDGAPGPVMNGARSGLRPSGDCPTIAVDYRDVALAAQLRVIQLRATALRCAWAMQRLCKEAEKAGVDAAYWRTLAADTEARAL